MSTETTTATTERSTGRRRPDGDQTKRRVGEACYGDYPGVDRVPKKKPAKKRAKKSASQRTAKTTTPSNKTPRGLWPVGTFVKFLGGARLKNRWLKKGMVGRVFGYRPGRKGGGLYAIRFEGGVTLLATKRVSKRGGTR